MLDQDKFISAISIVVVATAAVFWLLKRMKLRRARSWPSEVGRVESSSVRLESGGGQPGSAAYYAELKYSYTVQGRSYSGGLRRRFILKGRADKWIGKYSSGNPLTVRYNANKVEDSLLLESDQAGAGRVPRELNPMGNPR
jgi:hypothetical protein